MKILLKIILLITLFFVSCQQIRAEGGAIYYDNDRRVDTVDFGLTIVGDTLRETFYIGNTGDDTLRITGTMPSFGILEYQGRTQDKEEFDRAGQDTIDFKPGQFKKITILFISSSNYPAGKKIALLRLAVFDKDKVQNPEDDSQLDTLRDYLLIARKTNKYIEAFEDSYDFDSVYIDPIVQPEIKWKVKNVWKEPLRIDDQKFDILSPKITRDEFTVEGAPSNDTIPAGTLIDWIVKYIPENTGRDSARIELSYRPDPQRHPDSILTIDAKFYGTGVLQKLLLTESNYDIYRSEDIYNDTIDVGEIKVNYDEEKIITGTIQNQGNMQFGVLSQEVNFDDNTRGEISLINGLPEDKRIITEGSHSFSIKIKPEQAGSFLAKYIVESDIVKRNIKNFPAKARRFNLYIRGAGTAPKLSLASDTVDFGTVVFNPDHPECHKRRDTVVPIKNVGNQELKISLQLEQGNFSFMPGKTTIPPYSETSYTFSFDSQLDTFSTKVTIFTNEIGKNSHHDLILKAIGSRAKAGRISIPDKRGKPGSTIEYPLLTDGERMTLARVFNDTLTYDQTLLSFDSYNPTRTASEGGEYNIFETEPGRLAINLSMPPGTTFRNVDTLIKLRFRAFLGHRISFPVSFSNPRFGDGKCPEVMTLETFNGSFTLDSLCGLDYKVYERNNADFRLETPEPNPASRSSSIEFEMAFKTNARLELFNAFGEKVLDLVGETLPAGTYKVSIPANRLSPGIYFCRMEAGIFKKSRTIIISR